MSYGMAREAADAANREATTAVPGRTRGFAWVVAAATAYACLFLLWLIFNVGGTSVTQAVDDLSEAAAALLAGILCVARGRREPQPIRRAWTLLGASAASWGLGQVMWSYYELVAGRDVPFPSPADIGFLAAVPLALGAMLIVFSPPAGLTSRLRAGVDGLIAGSSILLISWLTVLNTVYDASTGSTVARVIGLAYPVGDLVTVSVVLIVAGRTRARARMPLNWIGAALVALAASDSAFAYLVARGDYATSNLLDTGWLVGFLILALAALKPPARGRRAARRAPRERTLLPYLPVLAAIALIALHGLGGGALGGFALWNALAVLAFLVARQVLTLRENHALTRDLETKVQARTLELAHSEQRFRALVQNVSDVISVLDADGAIVYVSPAVEDVFGYAPEQLMGERLVDRMHPDDRAHALSFFADTAAADGSARRLEARIRDSEGLWRQTETVSAKVVDATVPGRFVLTTRDVTERRRLEEQLAHRALHDPLTELPNRTLFTDRVDQVLARTRRNGQQCAVVFIDLDEFKSVNDTRGHESGDELLREVARRLAACVRPGDTVARLGGDEFAILLEDGGDELAVAAIERFQRALTPAVLLDGAQLTISASAGIATGGSTTDSVAELLRNADVAMYRAKLAGKARYELFRTEMRDAVVRRVALQSDLRHAVERAEIDVHYQPIVELSTRRIVGFEALARWAHPLRGMVSPLEFIAVAEDTGLIIPLGRRILEQSVSQLAAWSALTDDPLTMSVNVSGRQFATPGLVGAAADVLGRSRIDPGRLTLELTESILLKDVEETVTKLHELKRLGVRLAVDDFGTGFSSLAYLKRFPVDALKIDKSFVDDIAGGGRGAELARAVVELGRVLELDTVAEGIETVDQATSLEAAGCHLGQGYLFARALPAAEAEALLRSLLVTSRGGHERGLQGARLLVPLGERSRSAGAAHGAP